MSENAWLALLPILGTYLAFLFQSSYFSYFGVPASMVDVDIPKIIFSMAAIAVAGVIFIAMFTFAADLFRAQNPIIRIVGRGLTGMVIFLPFVLAATQAFTAKQLMANGLVLFALWSHNFWPPPQKTGESKSYLEQLDEQLNEQDRALKNKPSNIKQIAGDSVIAPFSLILFGSIYVLMLGGYCASTFGGKTYLQSNPNALYAGKADGVYIFTIVDPETDTFGNRILLLDASNPLELVATDRKVTRAR
ncbi:hypothetical protein L3V18_19165 [Lysobacter sp. TLK-CK17T]|uniref:Uncharacterized protein n=1 Tax=Marilutibacter chinensis TaxID=2912247 RepID=A0ABS9HYQ4_9GAMM|nr:hypothetical protein [Lysobacter chinensis]